MVTAVEREAHVVIDAVVPEVLCDTVHADHGVPRARRVGKAKMDVLRLLREDDELLSDPLELLHALLDLLRLRRLVPEALDEDLHVLDLALLGLPLGTQLLEVVLALPEIARVVSRIGHETLVLEGGNVAHAGVHERAVMAHEQDRAVVAGYELLEPANTLEVEVVGGLVEEEEVGMAQQQLGKGDAHLPTAREVGRGLVEVLDGKAEATENRPCPALELVSAKPLEAILRMAFASQAARTISSSVAPGFP